MTLTPIALAGLDGGDPDDGEHVGGEGAGLPLGSGQTPAHPCVVGEDGLQGVGHALVGGRDKPNYRALKVGGPRRLLRRPDGNIWRTSVADPSFGVGRHYAVIVGLVFVGLLRLLPALFALGDGVLRGSHLAGVPCRRR